MSLARSRRLDHAALVLLAVALVAGTGLRLHALSANPNVQHDEAWSYASAAGRLGPFLAAMGGEQGTSSLGPDLTGRWVPAGVWRGFWTSDGLSGVSRIAPDLSSYDVHPPLYFGLLHGWVAAFGEDVRTGRALNLVFAALTLLGIYGLARALGFVPLEGALAALVWAVSPAVVSISALARQYDLLALTTVLLVWGLVRVCAPGSRGRSVRVLDAVWLAAAAAAALLTHYQAVLLVAGAAVWAVAGALRRGASARRLWWPAPAALAAGTLAGALLAPGWSQAFSRERERLREFSTPTFYEKLDAIGLTLARFLGAPVIALGAMVAAILVLLLVLLVVPRARRALVARIRSARSGWWTVLFFLAVTAGGVCLQNLLFLSMPPQIGARYLAMAWPFVAFLPLLVFGLWPRARYALTAALCLLVLLPATVASPLLNGSGDRLPLRQLAGADAVLVDNVGAGELPRFLWYVPADAPVFAGTQDRLLADESAWASADLGETAYYVSILRTGGVPQRRDSILAALQKEHVVTLLASNGMVEIYAVTPRAAPAGGR